MGQSCFEVTAIPSSCCNCGPQHGLIGHWGRGHGGVLQGLGKSSTTRKGRHDWAMSSKGQGHYDYDAREVVIT